MLGSGSVGPYVTAVSSIVSEQALLKRCRDGDREAQQELYALNADRVYRLLLRLTGNRDDASELAQDVFVRVLTHLNRFEGKSDIRTWVYRIALNEGRQFLRRRQRQQVKLAEIDPAGDYVPTASAELKLDIGEALTCLAEEDRTLVVLRHFENLSYEEIAEAMGKPAGSVASGLYRARQTLRRILSPESLDKV